MNTPETMSEPSAHQADAYDAAAPITQTEYDATRPWQSNDGADEAFIAWIDSADGCAELERQLILGDTPLKDPRRCVHIARLAFYAGRQDGVAFAHGNGNGQYAWATKDVPAEDLAAALKITLPQGAL